ncbi:MAG: hypothetical protein JRI25_15605 [Deltaproteobacteria bacterium]|nr:hypothetical protein [Deltaproteobacteria bacterium]
MSILRNAIHLGFLCGAVWALSPRAALAQNYVEDTETGAANPTVDLTFNYTLTGASSLRVNGHNAPVATNITVGASSETGSVGFGTVDSLCGTTPTTGFCRRDDTFHGAFVGGAFSADYAISGAASPTANLGLELSVASTVLDERYQICAESAHACTETDDVDIYANGTNNASAVPASASGQLISGGSAPGSVSFTVAGGIPDTAVAGTDSFTILVVLDPL